MGRLVCAAVLCVVAFAVVAGRSPRGTARAFGAKPMAAPLEERAEPAAEPEPTDAATEEAEPDETGWLGPRLVKVVDAASRAPVEGARASVVLFDDRLDRRDRRDAVSDALGEMTLAKGYGREVAFLVRKRGYVANFRWLKYGELPDTVELVAGTPLLGRVVLPDGSPAKGAEVYAWDAETSEQIARDADRIHGWAEDSITTDAEGRFGIDGVVPGRPFTLAVLAPGYGVYRAVHEAVPELSIRLGDGAILEGRVCDAEGVPQAAAEVYVEPENEDGDYDFGIVTPTCLNARTVADADGRFRIVGIPVPGRYVATASVDYWARGASEPVDLTRRNEFQWRDVVVEKSASLEVRLADLPEGTRWLGWDLCHLDGSSAWSRFWSNSWREGRSYSRDGIHAGTYRLTATLEGRFLLDRVIDLRPGEKLDLVIPGQ